MMKRFAENTSRSAQRCMKGIINAGVRFVMERCEDATEKYASGDSGNAAASGVRGAAVASGYLGSASASGDQCLAVAWGMDSRARGAIGSYLVLSEYAEDGSIVDAQLVKVDGDQIKADTWYKLKNGEIEEVDR